MVTASHNPKAYTGVKLAARGRPGALRRRRHRRRAQRDRGGPGPAPGGGDVEEVDIWDEFREHALSFVDPSKVRPMRVVVDGGNGMAGPMAGPILRGSGSTSRRCTSCPTASSPTTSRTPCSRRTGGLIIDRVRSSGADLGIAWDGDADRCFFRRQRRVLRRRLRLRPARPLGAGQEPGRDDPLRPALEPRGARHWPPRAAALGPLAGRPRLLQGADARDGGRLRRRGLRPLLLPRLLERRLGDDPRAADARAALGRGPQPRRADGRVPLQVLHLRRDQLRGRRPRAKMAEIEERYREGAEVPTSTGSRSTTRTGTSTSAPPTPSRCSASTSSRWSPASTWRRSATSSWE